jgi:hypothetical protein
MHETWPSVRLQLDSLRQELLVLRQEFLATPDAERRAQLFDWALACCKEFEQVLGQYQAQVDRREERRGWG